MADMTTHKSSMLHGAAFLHSDVVDIKLAKLCLKWEEKK